MFRALRYTLIILALLLGGGFLLWQVAPAVGIDASPLEKAATGFYLSLRQEDIETPFSDSDTPQLFTIYPGETAATVAPRLEEAGLIRDASLFRLLAWYRGADVGLLAGQYELRPNMSMEEILQIFQEGRVYQVTITIPEGWRAEEIADYFEEQNLVDGSEFMALLASDDFDFDFLQDRAEAANLEGYLFPDTYSFPPNIGGEAIIDLMLRNFGNRFTAEMRTEARSSGLSIYQVVTLASVVEREAVLADDRPLIAGVLFNRLDAGMPLEADATVQYALGYDPAVDTWWPDLSGINLREVNSPYNTYLHTGLPPGPIANPGLSSILAVLQPVETGYYYYTANYQEGDGSHVFAETYEEHLENIAKYGQP